MDFDLASRVTPGAARLLTELLTGATCFGLAALMRLVLQAFVGSAPAFGLSHPAVLLATLIAGWRAGLVTLTFSMFGIWYVLLAPQFEFWPLTPPDAGALVVNTVAGLLIILLGQASRARAPDDAEARSLLLREMNHRVKNNFQMMAGLLDMQRRAAADPAVGRALESVIERVRSLGHAHAALYAPSGDVEAVDIGRYLDDLCRGLSDSLLLNTLVHLTCEAEPARMASDRAAAIGIVVNELVTNAVKHAFPGGRTGVISVGFARHGEGWRLTVADDGVGLAAAPPPSSGIGRRLVQAFVRQARGVLTEGEGPGARFVIDLAD